MGVSEMVLFDKPIGELRHYQAPDTEPADFDAFWARTLRETEQHDLDPQFVPLDDSIYSLASVSDVSFHGFGGQAIKGWFIEPAGNTGRLPCIVTYIGYGGGRSLPVDHLAPAVAGFANLVMDTRGQGSSWSPGDTPDNTGSGAHYPGFMTQGIESPETYYFRRVFTDAVRAVQAAAAHPHVDAGRIAVAGGSQGGGIAIAAAALAGDRVKLALPDVPFMCHFRRATEITDKIPYHEIAMYLKCHRDRVEQVFRTLAYFDGVNFAPRIKARCLLSAGLMDMVCPPSTIFAAYNRIRAPKDLRLYDYNEHEGGGPFHTVERLRYARQHL
jgi:cephalosporin-C deacetylase